MDEDWDDLDDRINPPEFAPADLTSALSGLKMLGDDVYLRMQATNVGVVDNFLNILERTVLTEMGQMEGTPETAFFLQA